MTKIVFHIGDHKTGSTAIQSTLANGSWTSPDVKLVYAKSGRAEHAIAHFRLSKAMDDKGNKVVAKLLGNLRDEIAHTNPDVIVLSSEGFEEQEPEAMKEALSRSLADVDHELQIVAYVRPHAARILSSFAERIKIGMISGTLEAFHERNKRSGRFKYLPRFQRWRDAFGKSFVLSPMIRDHLRDRDVVSDFLHIALGGAKYAIQATPVSNESLSLEDLAMVRALQQKLRPKDGTEPDNQKRILSMKHSVGWSFAGLLQPLAAEKSTKLKLHRSMAEDIAAFYMQDAIALDDMFFNGSPMADDLRNASIAALQAPQSLELDALFQPNEQRLLRVWLDLTTKMINSMEPEVVRMALQAKDPNRSADDEEDSSQTADQ